jgi:hypothetical protein
MNKLIITMTLTLLAIASTAQTGRQKDNMPYRFTTEPAIGIKTTSMDVQLSNLLQYNIHRKFSMIFHTAITYGLPLSRMSDIDQHYNYAILQKFGIGTSIYTKHTISTISFLAGIKYYAYSGTLNNEQFPEHITTTSNGTTSDYGFMYNLKMIRKKYFLSARLYIPVKDGIAGLGENSAIEIGVGIKLK